MFLFWNSSNCFFADFSHLTKLSFLIPTFARQYLSFLKLKPIYAHFLYYDSLKWCYHFYFSHHFYVARSLSPKVDKSPQHEHSDNQNTEHGTQSLNFSGAWICMYKVLLKGFVITKSNFNIGIQHFQRFLTITLDLVVFFEKNDPCTFFQTSLSEHLVWFLLDLFDGSEFSFLHVDVSFNKL